MDPLAHLRSRIASAVLGYYREAAHPHAELVPRGRVGLHAIARTCLAPGDRVLVSPVTCHTVVEAFLQAGVVPLFTDIDPRDGNIDISRLGIRSLRAAKAILTTNLYGNPDDAVELGALARRHGLLLIEDCAHVFETTVGGRRVGTIGDLSVFSFKKFFDVPGGVVTGRDAGQVARIGQWIRLHCRYHSASQELAGWARGKARSGIAGGILEARRRLSGWAAARLRGREAAGAGDASTTSGGAPAMVTTEYLTFPVLDELRRVAECVADPERFRARWDGGNRELVRRVPLEYRKSPRSATVVHMVVPFSCAERNGLVTSLRQEGIPVWFLYDPPMNERYAAAIPADSSLDLDRLEEWRRHILPLPGKYSDQIIAAFGTPRGGPAAGTRRAVAG